MYLENFNFYKTFHLLKRTLVLIIYGLFFCFSISCLGLNQNFNQGTLDESYEKSYEANFHQVWKALQLTMKNYPLKVNDMDQGILETRWIQKKMYWKPPYSENRARSYRKRKASRYKLRIQVVRLKEENDGSSEESQMVIEEFSEEEDKKSKKERDKETLSKKKKKGASNRGKGKTKKETPEDKKSPLLETQVLILKTIHKKRDFFSDEEALISDGIEERILLYRIGREVKIAKELNQKM